MTQTQIPTAPHETLRFTVADLQKMMNAGLIAEGEHLELIDGVIYTMAPMGDKHYTTMAHLTETLVLAFSGKAKVVPQAPMLLRETHSQPEPDFVVIPRAKFNNQVVRAEDTALVIEISDSTLEYDRSTKLGLYANNGVREYWIVNLQNNQLEVYRDPSGATYKSKFTLEMGQKVCPLGFEDIELEWWS